jgi:hypothetical protein
MAELNRRQCPNQHNSLFQTCPRRAVADHPDRRFLDGLATPVRAQVRHLKISVQCSETVMAKIRTFVHLAGFGQTNPAAPGSAV